MKLLQHSNPIVLWHQVVNDAESHCSLVLADEIKAYVALLLHRYTNKPECIQKVIATLFLHGMKLGPRERRLAFQEIGDNCLIFSGLFPKLSEKRLVSLSYFIHMGQRAYQAIATKQQDIFELLASQFVAVMDVLQSIRSSAVELSPLETYALWDECHSQRAFRVLMQYSDAIPLVLRSNTKN